MNVANLFQKYFFSYVKIYDIQNVWKQSALNHEIRLKISTLDLSEANRIHRSLKTIDMLLLSSMKSLKKRYLTIFKPYNMWTLRPAGLFYFDCILFQFVGIYFNN